MIDIGNDNLDNELNIEKYRQKLLDFQEFQYQQLANRKITFKEYNKTIQRMENKNNPKELEYWRNIFPTKSDNELEEYRVKWSKENPKYLKFKNL
jgi:hypothetical protein